MNWDYVKDNRTDEQVKHDFDIWKKYENKLINWLKKYFIVYERYWDEKFWVTETYWPDFCILTNDSFMPIEFKYTNKELEYVEWKENQYRSANRFNWYLLQFSTNDRFAIIPRHTDWEYIERWYCNKPCIRFYPVRYDAKDLLKVLKNEI